MGYKLSDEGEDAESSAHIFNNLTFWNYFETQVLTKAWKCDFPPNLLTDTLNKDAELYTDDSVFQKRRRWILKLVQNDTMWITFVLGACKELANKHKGPYSKELNELHMMEPFQDFVDHIGFFYKVASIMKSRGQTVHVYGQDSSKIHDIDKLDPIMMIGYSERFEDNVTTSVWNHCVDRHTTVNRHHQAHCLWHDCCTNENEEYTCCDDMRTKAVREMICDKVSRRVQKGLGGRLTEDMWNVEEAYFKGLTEDWVVKAMDMMHSMRRI
ncbi:hypothetical protein CEXT_92981 [Caerostris extrusa]|uniref:Uncharacterized protein n=1 Tax=Caerostris extrusa TaxID=172846 RepID=A0AAV4Q5A2_CAEEX|nr:hypothetical protein CEXT_92981 [Caerostris extrusa]